MAAEREDWSDLDLTLATVWNDGDVSPAVRHYLADLDPTVGTVSKQRLRQQVDRLSTDAAARLRRMVTHMYGE